MENTDKVSIKELVQRGENADSNYFEYAKLVATALPNYLHEALIQLVNGPVHDGDVMSKTYRDELLDYGLGIRCCHQGKQGYTGATYFAYSVSKQLPPQSGDSGVAET
ncbi:hypothetical protein KKJ25_12265 [Xenorhabdus bovienii]|uniref:hypothetical protein n=1 Tax=Xenorhabdus bovienii TaxID=40576 RepID=UPI00237C862E|nr:hypothetical protein [Xenorhabdus bovienii]MDE1495699.1 hypothetical protein [Xenorhabdus bovienii]MDE9464663.1 hypothetical protein [Xenorhabdus bovienii]MDE9475289.1 hypothetical protein [Xenorhabdus bovienii]